MNSVPAAGGLGIWVRVSVIIMATHLVPLCVSHPQTQVYGPLGIAITQISDVQFSTGVWQHTFVIDLECPNIGMLDIVESSMKEVELDLQRFQRSFNSTLMNIPAASMKRLTQSASIQVQRLHVMQTTFVNLRGRLDKMMKNYRTGWDVLSTPLCINNLRMNDRVKRDSRSLSPGGEGASTEPHHPTIFINGSQVAIMDTNVSASRSISLMVPGQSLVQINVGPTYFVNLTSVTGLTNLSIAATTSEAGHLGDSIKSREIDTSISELKLSIGPDPHIDPYHAPPLPPRRLPTTPASHVSSPGAMPDDTLTFVSTSGTPLDMPEVSPPALSDILGIIKSYDDKEAVVKLALSVAPDLPATVNRTALAHRLAQYQILMHDLEIVLNRMVKHPADATTDIFDRLESCIQSLKFLMNEIDRAGNQARSVRKADRAGWTYLTAYKSHLRSRFLIANAHYRKLSQTYQMARVSSSRDKRALLGFIGSLQRDLFGVATEDMIADNTKLLKGVQTEISRTKDKVIKLSRDFTTAMRLETSRVNKALSAVSLELKRLTDWTTHAGAAIDKLSLKLSETDVVQDAITIMVHGLSQIGYLETQIQLLDTTVTDRENWEFGIIHMMASGVLDMGAIPVSNLLTTLEEVGKALSSTMSLLTVDDVTNYYKATIAKLGVVDDSLRVIVDIPVKDRLTNYATWKVSVIPIKLADKWMLLNQIPPILVTHLTGWMSLTSVEYQHCLDNPIRDCMMPVSWASDWGSSCASSIYHAPASDHPNCQLRPYQAPMGATDDPTFYVKSITGNTWLISPSDHSWKYHLHCVKKNGEPSVVEKSGVGLISISVPPLCTIRVGHHVLVPRSGVVGSTRSNITRFSKWFVFAKINNTMVPTIKSSDNSIVRSFTKWYSANPLTANLSILTSSDDMTLNRLLDSTDNDTVLYANEMSALEHVVSNKLEELESTTRYTYPAMSIIQMLVTVVFIGCLGYMYWRIHRLTLIVGVLTAAHKPSLAMPLNASDHIIFHGVVPDDDYIDDIADIPKHSNLQMTPALTDPSPHDKVTHYVSTNVHPWGDLIMGIIMMVGMAWMLRKHDSSMRALQSMLVRQGGYAVLNQQGVHLAGEARLIGIFSLMMQSYGSAPGQDSIPVQLCTIPGYPSEWRCIERESLANLIVNEQHSFWTASSIWKMKWGPLCLVHRDNQQTDLCHELPQTVEVFWTDVKAALSRKHAALLKSMYVTGLVSLYLATPDGVTILWTHEVEPSVLDKLRPSAPQS